MKIVYQNHIFEKLKILLLFIGLLYAFIPFGIDGNPLVYKIHMFFLMLITLYALYIDRFQLKMNILGKVILFILLFFILLSTMIGYAPFGVLILVSIIFSFITGSVIHYNSQFKYYFVTALQWLIVFSIIIFFLQMSILIFTGNIISFHEIIFPISESRIGIDQNFKNLYRLGGLYTEPGSYANWMYLFLIIYMILNKMISSPLIIIGIVSIILSASVWGMVFGSFLLLVILLSTLKSSSWKKKLIVIVSLLSLIFLYFNYFIHSDSIQFAQSKLSSNTNNGSTLSKKKFYSKIIENSDDFLVIGDGFTSKIYKGISSPQDAGIVVNLIIVFGVLFTIVIFFILTISIVQYYSWSFLFAFLPILLSKIYFFDPSFWLLYFLIIYEVNFKLGTLRGVK